MLLLFIIVGLMLVLVLDLSLLVRLFLFLDQQRYASSWFLHSLINDLACSFACAFLSTQLQHMWELILHESKGETVDDPRREMQRFRVRLKDELADGGDIDVPYIDRHPSAVKQGISADNLNNIDSSEIGQLECERRLKIIALVIGQ